MVPGAGLAPLQPTGRPLTRVGSPARAICCRRPGRLQLQLPCREQRALRRWNARGPNISACNEGSEAPCRWRRHGNMTQPARIGMTAGRTAHAHKAQLSLKPYVCLSMQLPTQPSHSYGAYLTTMQVLPAGGLKDMRLGLDDVLEHYSCHCEGRLLLPAQLLRAWKPAAPEETPAPKQQVRTQML